MPVGFYRAEIVRKREKYEEENLGGYTRIFPSPDPKLQVSCLACPCQGVTQCGDACNPALALSFLMLSAHLRLDHSYAQPATHSPHGL